MYLYRDLKGILVVIIPTPTLFELLVMHGHVFGTRVDSCVPCLSPKP